jgi:hypothetical protein
MTLSGATGPDPKLLLDNLAGVSSIDKELFASASPSEPAESMRDKSESELASVTDSVTIDIPPQTAAEENSEPVPAFLPPLVPIVKPIIPRSRAEICDSLTAAAQSNDLPVPFFIRLLFQESGFRPGVVSRAGAEGIAQFMPATSASVGLDNPYDPLQAIAASARLLRDLAQQFGNFGLAAAAYNAGPRRVQDWLAKKGKLPQETQGYVRTITGRPAELWIVAEAGSPAVKLQRHAPCQETAGLLAWNGPERIPLPPRRNDTTRAVMPLASRGVAMLATRAQGSVQGNVQANVQANAHVKIARHGAKMMTASIDTGAPTKAPAKDGVKDGVKNGAKEGDKQSTKQAAVQLAASKHKQHKLQVSQR